MLTEQERGVLTQDEADLADILHGTDIQTWAKYVPPLVKAIAGARLRIRELEPKAVGWDRVMGVLAALKPIPPGDPALIEAILDYVERTRRAESRLAKAIEAAELYRNAIHFDPQLIAPQYEPDRLLAEAKGEAP